MKRNNSILVAGIIAGTSLGVVPVAIAFGGGITAMEQTERGINPPNENITEDIDWLEVNIETPGSLGVELLYKVNTLADVKALKVSGQLNSADETTVANLTAIEHLDLSEAQLNSLPNNIFQHRWSLKTLRLPDGLSNIGEYALSDTNIEELEIPASVTAFGKNCCSDNAKLRKVTVKSSASLGSRMFYQCKALETVELADGIKTIDTQCFYNCQAMTSVHLPSSLQRIESWAFYNTNALKTLVLPESLQYIGSSAFSNSGLEKIAVPEMTELQGEVFSECRSLEEIVLPAKFENRNSSILKYCISLKRVVLPASIPPQGTSDWFSYVNKSQIALVVPDFAVVNYKLDTYWKDMGSIEGGADYSQIYVNNELSFANNRRPEKKASVEITEGGRLSIGGIEAFRMETLDIMWNLQSYNYNEYKCGQIINSSPAVTASEAELRWRVYENLWYFVTFPAEVRLSDLRHSEGRDFIVREYDGASRAANGSGQNWKDLAEDALLEPGKGYIIRCQGRGDIIVPVTGDNVPQLLSNADRVLSPVAHQSEKVADAGWNLLGNPWTSYYDMSMSDLNTPILIYNSNYNRYDAFSMIDDHVVLLPGQAFFTQQTDEGTVTLPTSGRCFSSAGVAQAAKARRAEGSNRRIFDLTVSGNGKEDRTRIVFNRNAVSEYEVGRDAAKFFADSGDALSVYTLDNNGDALSINERPQDAGAVALLMTAPEAGVYSLTATRADGRIIVRDLETGAETRLVQGESMIVEIPGNDEISSRYVAKIDDTLSGVISVGSDDFDILAGYGFIMTQGVTGTVRVYTCDGRLVASGYGDSRFDLAAGLYVVVTEGASRKCVVK